MQIKKTRFKGLKIVRNKICKDSRGYFKEDFKSAFFKGAKFIFSCTCKSKKNVLRGLHMQTKNKQGKFVSVLKGSILDVVVDLRKNSRTFGKHYKIRLSDKEHYKNAGIPNWTHYRFEVLPVSIGTKARKEIENMTIRAYATLFSNTKDVKSIKISNYKLVNRKIKN